MRTADDCSTVTPACDVNGILAAAHLEHGGTIYITEGEKDAHRLWSRRQSGFRDDVRRGY